MAGKWGGRRGRVLDAPLLVLARECGTPKTRCARDHDSWEHDAEAGWE